MSASDLTKGTLWTDDLRKSLKDTDVALVCVTPENSSSPWPSFEAGVVWRALDDQRICPVLFGLSPEDLPPPLGLFEATVFDRLDFSGLMSDLNERAGRGGLSRLQLSNRFGRLWPELESQARTISAEALPGDPTTIRAVIGALAGRGIDNPDFGSFAHFRSGFESHATYGALVGLAKSRMLLWGRKNRKIFDKEYLEFWHNARRQVDDGFDLRILFLNPDGDQPIIRAAHADADFAEQLTASLKRAIGIIESADLDPHRHLRLYETARPAHLLVVDDVALFTPIRTQRGVALPLTNAPFTATTATSGYGMDLVAMFERCWDEAGAVPATHRAPPDRRP